MRACVCVCVGMGGVVCACSHDCVCACVCVNVQKNMCVYWSRELRICPTFRLFLLLALNNFP